MDPDPVPGAACTSPAARVSSVHNTSGSPASPADASSLLAPPVVTARQQTAGDSQPKLGLHAPTELSFESAVDLTLRALARSVAVRCQCIDQHSPQIEPLGPAIAPASAVSSAPTLPKKAGTPAVLPSANSSAAQQGSGLGRDPIHLHDVQMNDGCMSEGRAQRHISSRNAAPAVQPGASMLNTQQSCDVPEEEEVASGAVHRMPSSDTAVPPSGSARNPSETPVHCSDTAVPPSHAFPHSSVTAVQPPETTSYPSGVSAHPSDTVPHASKTSPHYSETGVQSLSWHEAAALQPAPVLILFSGGVDSTLIAALAHQALPADVPIDLASVCFTGGMSGDRQAALDAVQELAQFSPGREWRLIQVDSSLQEVDRHKDWLLGMFVMPCYCCYC